MLAGQNFNRKQGGRRPLVGSGVENEVRRSKRKPSRKQEDEEEEEGTSAKHSQTGRRTRASESGRAGAASWWRLYVMLWRSKGQID
jgi:hypothetical protein